MKKGEKERTMEEEKWKSQRELLACRCRKRPPAKEVEKARKKNPPERDIALLTP